MGDFMNNLTLSNSKQHRIKREIGQVQWCTPVILALREGEAREPQVQTHLGNLET